MIDKVKEFCEETENILRKYEKLWACNFRHPLVKNYQNIPPLKDPPIEEECPTIEFEKENGDKI